MFTQLHMFTPFDATILVMIPGENPIPCGFVADNNETCLTEYIGDWADMLRKFT